MESKICLDDGGKWNEQTRQCEKKRACPAGTVLEGSACVPVTVECKENEHFDQGRCVPNPAPVTPPPEAKDKIAEKKPRPLSTLGLEATIGLSGRLGSMSTGYESDDRAGWLYGAGVYYAPSRKLSLGLSYTQAQGGSEQYGRQNSLDTAKISRTFHVPALHARIYPVRSQTMGMYVGLTVGAAFQTASVSGSQQLSSAQAALPYKADSDPASGIALGLGLGFDYDIDNDLALLSSLNFTNYQFSSDPMKGVGSHVVGGTGSTSQLDFRFALQYRFDLAGKQNLRTATSSF